MATKKDPITLLEEDHAHLTRQIDAQSELIATEQAAFEAGDRDARDRIRDATARRDQLLKDAEGTEAELEQARIVQAKANNRATAHARAGAVLEDNAARAALGAELDKLCLATLRAFDKYARLSQSSLASVVHVAGAAKHSRDAFGEFARNSVRMHAGNPIGRASALFVMRLLETFEGDGKSIATLSPGWSFDYESELHRWSPTRFADAAARQNASIEHHLGNVSRDIDERPEDEQEVDPDVTTLPDGRRVNRGGVACAPLGAATSFEHPKEPDIDPNAPVILPDGRTLLQNGSTRLANGAPGSADNRAQRIEDLA